MKSVEVYRVLRDVLKPWSDAHGFKRTGGGMLGWYRPLPAGFLVFWCQCSQDGWDAYAGSKFVVELQQSEQPAPGTGRRRARLAELLDDGERERVRTLQNDVIRRLPRPPADHWLFQHENLVSWHRAKLEPVAAPYSKGEDVWLRYHTYGDVKAWGSLVVELLPSMVQRFSEG